ncbi:hypothetical protein [Vibrio furnissii]|nr:hypothetical protein [Vibrio furnissii]EEX42737.1 hypothetical protein VFA_000494 [Vibrio furnissii CIP 102972]SUP43675.1 Uncharacterised protein [Vibrio furnissii]
MTTLENLMTLHYHPCEKEGGYYITISGALNKKATADSVLIVSK